MDTLNVLQFPGSKLEICDDLNNIYLLAEVPVNIGTVLVYQTEYEYWFVYRQDDRCYAFNISIETGNYYWTEDGYETDDLPFYHKIVEEVAQQYSGWLFD